MGNFDVNVFDTSWILFVLFSNPKILSKNQLVRRTQQFHIKKLTMYIGKVHNKLVKWQTNKTRIVYNKEKSVLLFFGSLWDLTPKTWVLKIFLTAKDYQLPLYFSFQTRPKTLWKWVTYEKRTSNPSCPDTEWRKKINLNLCVHSSLWCFKRIYEGQKGLPKTSWGNKQKCGNKNFS